MPDQDQRLEQRVKTLEYELKILKNEVQRALLDVQEQILAHYYPTLRAEEKAPAEDVVQSVDSIKQQRAVLSKEAGQPAQPTSPQPPTAPAAPVVVPATAGATAAQAAMPPFAEADPEALSPMPLPGGERPPAVRKVTLDDVRRQRSLVVPVAGAPAAPAAAGADQVAVEQLVMWAANSVETIGRERTTVLMEAFIGKGIVPATARDTLLRIITMTNGPAANDRVPTNDVLTCLFKLNEALGRKTDVEEALTMLEEAKLG